MESDESKKKRVCQSGDIALIGNALIDEVLSRLQPT